ncbi:Na+/H+ antiporter [Dispira simplex]|nr:Na+/H+ antiporter [Dispira simplex]
MATMWAISGVIIHLVFQLPWLDSFLIASCVAPTDPILANSVIKGRFAEKRVPRNIRNILAAESGSNDGLGFPFLYLILYLMIYSGNTGKAIGKWFYMAWAYEVFLSVLIGAVVGYSARKLLYLAESHCLIDKESFLSYSIALTLFLLGVVGLIASDDLLAVFTAGTAFAWDDWFHKETKEAHLQEVIDMLFNISFFVYFGTIIPWSMFNIPSLGLDLWRFFVCAILILIFRRLPVMLLLCKFIPVVKTWREAVFAGWFGPMGVGALYYIMVARTYMESHEINPAAYDTIYPIVSFVVLSSVLVHGITIPLFHLGSAINTRTLTNNSMIGNFVSRLPIIRSGQQIVIQRPESGGDELMYKISSVKRMDDSETAMDGSQDMADQEKLRGSVEQSPEGLDRRSIHSQMSISLQRFDNDSGSNEPQYLEIRVHDHPTDYPSGTPSVTGSASIRFVDANSTRASPSIRPQRPGEGGQHGSMDGLLYPQTTVLVEEPANQVMSFSQSDRRLASSEDGGIPRRNASISFGDNLGK